MRMEKCGILLACVLGAFVTVECRSIGGPVGVNSPDQANYQDYGEQQEYVERQVRDVQDRPEKYNQKGYAGENRREVVKNSQDAAYRNRDNSEDEDMEGVAADDVAADRNEFEERAEKKDEDAPGAEVADQRNDESLRQPGNDAEADVGYRRPRENGDEPVRMTEAAQPQVAEAGYDAMNEPPAEPSKDNSAYAAPNYNYDYAPEEESPEGAESQQNMEQNVAPSNEEGAPPAQYEQGN